MKRSTLWFLVYLAAVIFLYPQSVNAQNSSTNQTRPEQLMTDLLEEVRMLRQEVRRLSAGTVRAQSLLERLRLQQAQVNRLNVDLSKVRAELTAIRSQRVMVKTELGTMQQKYDVGMLQPSELEAPKALLADLDHREPDLATRELQLNNELMVERGVLEELSKKLDVIEREMQAPIERPKP